MARPLAAAAIFAALSLTGEAGQAPVTSPAPADGLMRSELSLGGYTTTVSYLPALAADDPAHRGLFSASNSPDTAARVRVAAIESNAGLRLGSVALERQGRGTARYDLWLKGTSSSWSLEVAEAAGPGQSAAVLGETPLARQSGAASPQFSAALIPEIGNSARLVLRWADQAAVADVVVTAPPRSTRVDENRGANVTVNRSHTEDTSALSRARLLAQRNETMMRLSSGHQLSVSFQRSFATGERTASGSVPRTRGLAADGVDFARLTTTRAGEVVMLTEAAVPRLRIDRPLRFGAAEIAVGNQVPGFPGSYGLWLKRAANGWRLVFNHEPDAWGSQHDPKFDAAEVELQHSEGHTASRPFAVALVPTGNDRGRVIVIWGPHEWSADFVMTGAIKN